MCPLSSVTCCKLVFPSTIFHNEHLNVGVLSIRNISAFSVFENTYVCIVTSKEEAGIRRTRGCSPDLPGMMVINIQAFDFIVDFIYFNEVHLFVREYRNSHYLIFLLSQTKGSN